MATEAWLALGAGLLLVLSLGAEILRLRYVRGPWAILASALEVGAAATAMVALALAFATGGQSSPDTLQLVAWGLAAAILGTHLLLQKVARSLEARLIAGLLALVALALGILAPAPVTTVPDCPQLGMAFAIQWFLFLLGAGSATVAGSAGLEVILGAILPRRTLSRSAQRDDSLPILVGQGTRLALVALGAGLTLAAWWSGQAAGRLTSGDPHVAWLATTWLVAAASLLAWQTKRDAAIGAAALAALAAAIALIGLLVMPALGW